MEQLSRDHRTIIKALDLLRYSALRSEDATEPVIREYCRLIDFLKTFAGVCHFAKEERALFPKLMETEIQTDERMVAVMESEHDQARHLIEQMELAVASHHPREFSFYAQKYSEHVESHIAKEENLVFARASRILSPADDEALIVRFDEIESKIALRRDLLDELSTTLGAGKTTTVSY